MTYNYSVTYLTALNDFLEECKYKGTQETDLIKNFKLFFKYLMVLFEEGNFYAESSTLLIENFKELLRICEKLTFCTNDFSEICLEYYKIKKIRKDKILNNKRITIQFDEVSDDLDERKSFRALRANLIHCLDASYLRLIINNYKPLYTVHDSFGIDILSCDKLIEVANTSINKIYGYNDIYIYKNKHIKYYSNFILI
jgi:hypothetical protein